MQGCHIQIEKPADRISARLSLITDFVEPAGRSRLFGATPAHTSMAAHEPRGVGSILDPCAWRVPVYAWLLANHAKVVRARQHRNGWNRMHWAEIARIMEMEGVKGSRGDMPNANSG
jgi:hypothetical protein